MTTESLLAVFAHPDDESLASGGLLAWCASEGVDVSLVCATRGELGPRHGRQTASLATTREAELRAAARTLGVSRVVLLDYEDGMLPWVETGRLEADIGRAIEQCQPDVVVTFGEDGLYWHPDHIAVHHRVTASVRRLGRGAPALYYVSVPAGRMRQVVERAARNEGDAQPPRQILGIDNVDAFGANAQAPTLVIDTGPYASRKLAALRCHVSQLGESALAHLSEEDAEIIAVEHYRRAPGGPVTVPFIERFASTHASTSSCT